MTWPRWWAYLRARFGGYFWLPCPICCENFAGFEAGADLYWSGCMGRMACSKDRCQTYARLSNDKARQTFTYEFVNVFNGKRTPVSPK